MKLSKTLTYLFGLLWITAASCSESWLDIKPDKKLLVPTTAQEVQALLDNTNRMNTNMMSNLLEVSTDNVYLTTQQWYAKNNVQERNAYIWEADVYEGGSVLSWINHYGQVYYANTAMEITSTLTATNANEAELFDNIVGSALFFRSWAFYNLAQLFCKPYDEQTADMDWGIPLRLSSDMHQSTSRARVSETYSQIIADIELALPLLPEIPLVPTRPSKAAAYALLSKTYLSMAKFEKAYTYADSALRIKSDLIDYNVLDPNLRYPFQVFNRETIFYQTMAPTTFYIDSSFLARFDSNDLRRELFFHANGDQYVFKGSYSNSRLFFAGIAVDELYLIRAECGARMGKSSAVSDIQELMKHRFRNWRAEWDRVGDKDILSIVLDERRKQLVYRGIRWHDLRRLNKERSNAVVLERIIEGVSRRLMPDDARYVFALPDDVIRNNPDIVQNER